jgi:hypothetical protein
MTTKNDKDRARVDYDGRLRKILDDAVVVAEIAYSDARNAMESGKRKGVLNLQDIGQRAIGEIVRLRDLIGEVEPYQNHYTIEFLEPPTDTPDV